MIYSSASYKKIRSLKACIKSMEKDNRTILHASLDSTRILGYIKENLFYIEKAKKQIRSLNKYEEFLSPPCAKSHI